MSKFKKGDAVMYTYKEYSRVLILRNVSKKWSSTNGETFWRTTKSGDGFYPERYMRKLTKLERALQ